MPLIPSYSYPFKHWVATILFLGPAFISLYYFIIRGFILLTDIKAFILYGAFFSLPLFTCYLALYYFFIQKFSSSLVAKIFMNAFVILGVIFTFQFVFRSIQYDFIFLYAVSVIITSCFFRIAKTS